MAPTLYSELVLVKAPVTIASTGVRQNQLLHLQQPFEIESSMSMRSLHGKASQVTGRQQGERFFTSRRPTARQSQTGSTCQRSSFFCGRVVQQSPNCSQRAALDKQSATNCQAGSEKLTVAVTGELLHFFDQQEQYIAA